jgi:cell division protein FtsN
MGKICCNNKTKFIAAAVFCLLLPVCAVYAADSGKEFDLFDRGYKDYLSYQPEKAAGEFRMFLKEFPGSSASDAVMFWLGKSLMQLKSFEEAKQIFAEMKQQFPDSPFVRYADKELEGLKGTSGFAGAVPGTVVETKIADNVAVKTVKTGDQAEIQKKEIQRKPDKAEVSKSVPPQKELPKETKSPIETAVAATRGRTSPPVAALEPKKEVSKKVETPVGPAVAAESGKPLPAAPALEQKVVYSTQVGVFKHKKRANVLKAKFMKEGYTVRVTKGTLQGADVFKVLVGEFTDRNKAEAIANKLKRVYRLNTLVVASEVWIAQAERPKEAAAVDTAKSLSGHGERKTGVLTAGDGKEQTGGVGEKPLPRSEGPEASKEKGIQVASGAGAGSGKTLQSAGISKRDVVYSVQIGVFTKQNTAERLKSEFEREGYPVKILKGASKGRDEFKVLVGQFADKNDAKSVARTFEGMYGENTIVSMSEGRDEIPPAPAEFIKAAEDMKKPEPVSGPAQKEPLKTAATAAQTISKVPGQKDLGAKSQRQQNKEEINKQVVASKVEKEHVKASVEPLKDEKKQTGAGLAEKKRDDMTVASAQTVNKRPEPKTAEPESPKKSKSDDKSGKNPEVLKNQNERLNAPVQPFNAEKPKAVEAVKKLQPSPPRVPEKKTGAEFVKAENEKNVKSDAGRSVLPQSDLPQMEIKDIKYTVREVPEYIAASQSLCDKLQIKEVLWRTGNDNEDFLNEEVLYDEAKSLHIAADKNELTEMTENYQLDDREADYLQRYLTISGLIERKIRDMPEEKVVEAIIVRYDENDRYMKIVLGSELQNMAKKGTPFEEIYRLYPDVVSFSVTGFPELEKGMKEKVQSVQDNGIVVTWSEGGYMILKPVFKGPVFRPFGDISPGLRGRMKTYVLAWTKGLREKYSPEQVKEKK